LKHGVRAGTVEQGWECGGLTLLGKNDSIIISLSSIALNLWWVSSLGDTTDFSLKLSPRWAFLGSSRLWGIANLGWTW
jgi:hypothetical protein